MTAAALLAPMVGLVLCDGSNTVGGYEGALGEGDGATSHVVSDGHTIIGGGGSDLAGDGRGQIVYPPPPACSGPVPD